MKVARAVLSWVFAFTALLCLSIAVWYLQAAVHRFHSLPPPRLLIVPAIFSLMAVIYAASWWTTLKGKPSARVWGVLASLTNISVFVLPMFLHSRSAGGHNLVSLAVGVAGLIAFAGRNEEDPGPDGPELNDSVSNASEPEDNHSE